jgi:hypothetical protein
LAVPIYELTLSTFPAGDDPGKRTAAKLMLVRAVLNEAGDLQRGQPMFLPSQYADFKIMLAAVMESSDLV